MKKYTVLIHGYGAEVTIGTVGEELKSLIAGSEKDLVDTVLEDLDDYGGWHEIDNQLHRWGAAGTYTVEVRDEAGETVLELGSENLTEHDTDEFELVRYEWFEPSDTDSLMCISFEKGSFFEGCIETLDDFDIKKMSIVIDGEVRIDGCIYGDIVSKVIYDEEEVYNTGGDTNGKSFEAYTNF